MDTIQRTIFPLLQKGLQKGKVLILYGPRRVGKTILIKEFFEIVKGPKLLMNGEDFAVQDMLKMQSFANYKGILGQNESIVIDEAQKIDDIGSKLKFIVDSFPDKKLLVTGSSAFDIENDTGEPLTGRKKTLRLFPLSMKETEPLTPPQEREKSLEERMVFGSYPELYSIEDESEKKEYLRELVNSYLLKDILTLDSIRNSNKLLDILKLIAYQVGGEVSMQKLGAEVGMSKNTVERYLDLLSKVFIIKILGGFSRNLRKEITKSKKIYFMDNGIRNAIINDFRPLKSRDDVGKLWENMMIAERLKYLSYNKIDRDTYFWRTYDQQEIDWVEVGDGEVQGFEFKYSSDKVKVPGAWSSEYPEASYTLINKNNYRTWLGID